MLTDAMPKKPDKPKRRRRPSVSPPNLHPVVKRLKAVRDEMDLTQVEFAEKLRISVVTLRNWEQARIVPDKTTLSFIRLWLDSNDTK